MIIPDPIPSVERYLASLHPEQQEVALKVRKEIYLTIPEVEETWKWNTPMYAYIRNLVYLNNDKEGMILGFMYGALMEDPAGIFLGKSKAQVRHLLFTDLKLGPWNDLRFYLQEAVMINEANQKIS